MPRWPIPSLRAPKPCENCGTTFTPKYATQRFCSVSCSKTGRFNAGWKDRPEVECATCGRAFRPRRDAGHRYCSDECRSRGLRGARPGSTGRHRMPNGYVRVLVPGRGYLYEHRVVMERTLGRPLRRNEDVHHIDEVRWHNDPSNLEVRERAQHRREHALSLLVADWSKVAGACLDCGGTDRRHEAHGYCTRCWQRRKKATT